jgi:ferredoxin-NADP reductase
MAEARTARLLASSRLNDEVALLRFGVEQDLVFTGGQYIIVNTGIPLGEGKTVKRAYSLLSSDADQRTFEIAVRRIDAGPGSNFMIGLEPGAELLFTGPWGKFRAPSEMTNGAPTLIVATDTGITAALGLLRSQSFQPRLAQTRLYWLVDSDSYFVPEDFVRERLPENCGHFECVPLPLAARTEWLARERDSFLEAALRSPIHTVYLSGDGSLIAAFRDALHALPSPPAIFIESFFNHQQLKATSKDAA